MTELIIATNNQAKLKEIRRLLEGTGIRAMSLTEAGLDISVVEDGGTFEHNAVKKAVEVAAASGRMALADDSGIEIDFLGGAPGVDSANYLGRDTPYPEKNARIVEMLVDAPEGKRGARFVCVAAAAYPNGEYFLERGELIGEIAQNLSGAGGFGYDPIFYVPQFGKTAAELSPAEKDSVSHRGVAFRKIIDRIKAL